MCSPGKKKSFHNRFYFIDWNAYLSNHCLLICVGGINGSDRGRQTNLHSLTQGTSSGTSLFLFVLKWHVHFSLSFSYNFIFIDFILNHMFQWSAIFSDPMIILCTYEIILCTHGFFQPSASKHFASLTHLMQINYQADPLLNKTQLFLHEISILETWICTRWNTNVKPKPPSSEHGWFPPIIISILDQGVS